MKPKNEMIIKQSSSKLPKFEILQLQMKPNIFPNQGMQDFPRNHCKEHVGTRILHRYSGLTNVQLDSQ